MTSATDEAPARAGGRPGSHLLGMQAPDGTSMQWTLGGCIGSGSRRDGAGTRTHRYLPHLTRLTPATWILNPLMALSYHMQLQFLDEVSRHAGSAFVEPRRTEVHRGQHKSHQLTRAAPGLLLSTCHWIQSRSNIACHASFLCHCPQNPHRAPFSDVHAVVGAPSTRAVPY